MYVPMQMRFWKAESYHYTCTVAILDYLDYSRTGKFRWRFIFGNFGTRNFHLLKAVIVWLDPDPNPSDSLDLQ